MKNVNETEELFDGIFRETLENSSAQVPPGVWEGVSSSLGSGSGIAGVAVKTAIWMKAAIAVVSLTVVSVIAYQVNKEEPVKTAETTPNTIAESAPLSDNTTTSANNMANSTPETTPNFKNKTAKPKSQFDEVNPPVYEIPTSGPNPIYSMDANLVNPMIDQAPGYETTTKEEKPVENIETPQQKEVKELNPSTEYTYFKDSSSIFIPTAVTPDGDGYNDSYLINLVGEESAEIIIYSISNEVLFRTTNKYQAWNCKLPNGEDAPAGSYLVKVIYQFKGKNKQTTVRKLTIIK